jgi:hypothetical protein
MSPKLPYRWTLSPMTVFAVVVLPLTGGHTADKPAHSNYAHALTTMAAGVATGGVADCERTLVEETVDQSTLSIEDLSISFLLTESQWNAISQEFGGKAVIYGIPIGASYSEYRQNRTALTSRYNLHDYHKYQAHYASSRLDSSSLEAYRMCIAGANKGLAVVSAAIGGPGSNYTVWLTYVPVTNQAPGLTADVTQPVNVDVTTINQQWSAEHFNTTVDRQFNVVPTNQDLPISFQVRVGSMSKVIDLPPLKTPQLKREIRIGAKFMTCAGWSCGSIPDQKIEGCVEPKHPKGALVLSTEHFIIARQINGGDKEWGKASPDQICVVLHAANTSGNSTTVIEGQVSAVEAYLPDE